MNGWFTEDVDKLRHTAEDAAYPDDDPRTSASPSRAQYERACTAIGVTPLTDQQCNPTEYDADEVRAAVAFDLHRQRAQAIYWAQREDRQRVQQRHPNGLSRADYDELCRRHGVRPTGDAELSPLCDRYHAAIMRGNFVPPWELELAHLRYQGMLNENLYRSMPPSFPPALDLPDSAAPAGGFGGLPEVVTTAVVTAAVLPFVKAFATKAGEDVYAAVRRMLPKALRRKEDQPSIRTIEIVDPDTGARLTLDVNAPAEATRKLPAVADHIAERADDLSGRLIYWDDRQRNWRVR